MLVNTLEICFGMLSLVCMFVALVGIVFAKKGNRIPAFISVCGGILYTMFLASAKQNMDVATLHRYMIPLIGFMLFAIVAYVKYWVARQTRRNELQEKITEFKRQCFDARADAQAI